ncbi:MAG: McrB family protein [Thiomicrospira sp.]
MNPFENFNHAQLYQTDNKTLEKLLIEAWSMKAFNKIQVFGEINKFEVFDESQNKKNGHIVVVLRNIRHPLSGEEIDFPILNVASIQEKSPFITWGDKKKLQENNIQFVKCQLEISPKAERVKHENPLLLNVVKGSIEEYLPLEMMHHYTAWDKDELSYISKAVFEHFLQGMKKKNNDQIVILEEEFLERSRIIETEFEKKVEDIKSQTINAEKQKIAHEKEVQKLNEKISKAEKVLEQKTESRNQLIQEIKELSDLEKEIQAKIEAHRLTEDEMAKQIERLKSYVIKKSELLRQLEIIDDTEDFADNLLGNQAEKNKDEFLSFQDDLAGDYAQAASYIQAYLLERDILYPRHIIENFFGLIRTNDLIILAGDSGSGKTNLVQSFAKAVGGVAKIIPVKPNWTSSEDLLGYYNPLEKKYLATPFLEALLEAKNHPNVPYFICLDEMNLARVEYYFADFLSKLEQRESAPEIQLYSDNESAHVLSELKNVLNIITNSREKYQKDHIVDFVQLMQDEEVNAEMKRAFGFGDKDSLIRYHSDIRRMLAGVIGIPSSIEFPRNVRIIGAINIDETTHYLSPKILDRAHIMKFKSPLLSDWNEIFQEVSSYEFKSLDKPLSITPAELGNRYEYPKFDVENIFCQLFMNLNKEYFYPLGIEFGMRTIRQGLNYIEIMSDFGLDNNRAVNNFILHKVLPKMHFDGNQKIGDSNKFNLLATFKTSLSNNVNVESIPDDFSALNELERIIDLAESNDWIVNYWS